MALLKKEDIIAQDAIDAPNELAKNLKKVAKELAAIMSAGKSADPALGISKSLKELNKETEQLTVRQKQLSTIDKQIIAEQQKLNKGYEDQQRKLVKLKVEQQQRNQKMREEARETSKLSSLYTQQSAKLNRLRKSYKDLVLSEKANTKEGRAMRREIETLDKKLKKVDATVGQYQRSVGNYGKAWRGVGSILRSAGVIGGIAGVISVMRGAFNTIKQFNQASANLASVLGKTRKEIKPLTDDAKRLGGATKFTATEVANLQTEFAKLGFTEQEILNVTEATLQLAAATNTDLAEAAAIAGSTLRAFGEDSTQTQRLVDIMAKSFSSSALDMGKFSVAMSAVAPVASSAGVSMEKTTALLGVLADNGLDASTAGTGLRNVFLDLADKGLTWDEAMTKINKSTNKNVTALELFGKRGATIGTILSQSNPRIEELAEQLRNAGGAAQKMADEQLNTLNGKLTLLSSAWDGFILGLEDGEGVIAKVFIKLTEFITQAVVGMQRLSKSTAQLIDESIMNIAEGNMVGLRKEIEETGKIMKETFGEANYTSITDDLIEARQAEIKLLKRERDDAVALGMKETELAARKAILIEHEIIKKLRAYGLQRDINEANKLDEEEVSSQEKRIAYQKEVNDLYEKYKKMQGEIGNEAGILDLFINAQKAKKYLDDLGDSFIESFLQKPIDPNDLYSEIIEEGDKATEAITKKEQEEADKRYDIWKEEYDRKQELIEHFSKLEKENIKETAAMGIDLFHAKSEAIIEGLLSENQAVQDSFDKQIEAADGNQERIDALNEQKLANEAKTQREVAKIRRRQAILDKAIAIGQIATNTATAIISALAPPPVGLGAVGGIPFSIRAGVLGAVQAGIVAAQPIPQFAKGTDNSPEGLAIVNEKGSEILESPDGSMKMINSNKPTLTYLEKGTKVHTAKESARMLGSNIMSSLAFQQINERTNDQAIINQLEGIKKTIKNKKEVHMNFDKHAVEFWTKKGELWSKIRNQDYA